MGEGRRAELDAALEVWDGDKAWDNGGKIQIQVSRSKRVLPDTTHEDLDSAQREVVEVLDRQVEDLRNRSDDAAAAWDACYKCLIGDKRKQIDGLLASLMLHLDYEQRTPPGRLWCRLTDKKPDPINLKSVPCDPELP